MVLTDVPVLGTFTIILLMIGALGAFGGIIFLAIFTRFLMEERRNRLEDAKYYPRSFYLGPKERKRRMAKERRE